MIGDSDVARIAAYLDGALSPAERQDVERLIATSEEARELVAEARRILDDVDDPAGTDVPPAAGYPAGTERKRPRGPGYPIVAVAAAAALAGIVFLTRETADTIEAAAAVRALPAEIVTSTPGWAVPMRSGGDGAFSAAGGERGASRTAFSVGVHWADAILAAEAADTTALLRASEALSELLADVPLSGDLGRRVVRELETSGSSLADRARALDSLGAAMAELLGEEWFLFGARTEAVRLSSSIGRPIEPAGAAYFSSIERSTWASPVARQLRTLNEALATSSPEGIGTAAAALIQAAGR